MKIELKGFQDTAVAKLLTFVKFARREAREGLAQAIVVSSPTGSGKTVTITQLMEWIVVGSDTIDPDPDAVFLWLSDSPELNEQSRDKIIRQSSVFKASQLILLDATFDQERFDAGRVYFLNIQKLGKDSLLTTPGDDRTYTIWQTIQNTAQTKPGHFYIILDEAHRGMTEKKRDREQAATIVQRFIKGYPEGGLDPAKLLVGMSATPERFNQLLDAMKGTITKREVDIDPDLVRTSGLLKDRIVVWTPEEKQPSDLTLLEEAARDWKRFAAEWAAYCTAQHLDTIVEPVLVIQVEDAISGKFTNTDLDEVVRVVERVIGPQPDGAWAHAFEDDTTLEYGGRKIRKVDASKIEYERGVKIVLFKMSLTTGWDCPRAEVMMSFRKAKDHTLIAQLIGRMVRTPLARSIEGNDVLNSVALYLPHYEQSGVNAIIERLRKPDADTGIAVDVELGRNLVTLHKAAGTEALFKALEALPSYRVERTEKISNVRRLMKLARRLAYDEIDTGVLDEVKTLIVTALTTELARLGKQPGFIANVAANQEIDVRGVSIEYGIWANADEDEVRHIKATPENINDLFEQAKRQLGRDGLEMDFLKARRDVNEAPQAKLEFVGVLQDKAAVDQLEKICQKKVQALFQHYRDEINALESGKQEDYNRIRRVARQPEAETLHFPDTLDVRRETAIWARHVYVDEANHYAADLNKWEAQVMEDELQQPGVAGWLRNMPRKAWSLSIPYHLEGEDRPLYPDFIIVRKAKGKLVMDLLDPHSSGLADAMAKARGLAEYAQKHGDHFGRIELIAKDAKGNLKRLDLNDETVRDKVKKVGDKAHLDLLFDEV